MPERLLRRRRAQRLRVLGDGVKAAAPHCDGMQQNVMGSPAVTVPIGWPPEGVQPPPLGGVFFDTLWPASTGLPVRVLQVPVVTVAETVLQMPMVLSE